MASSDLLPRFRELSPRDGGPRPGESLVIALSGGPDSVALLDLLRRLAEERDLRLVAAHLDHGLRDESGQDAEFCRDLCIGWGIPFECERVDVTGLARITGVGLEAAGRRARYDFFERVRSTHGCDRVATGHHLDDHAETLLMWLFRGTGLTGLRGIEASTPSRLRPLRSFRKAEIHDYVRGRGLEHRDDPSNESSDYLRNRVREALIPTIEEIFDEGALRRLLAFARRAEGEIESLEVLAQATLERCRIDPEDTEAAGSGAPAGGAHEEAEGALASTEDAGAGEGEATTPRLYLDRARWHEQPKALQLQALRLIARQWAPPGRQRWDEGNLLALLAFSECGESGKRSPLPGGGWLFLERDRLRFEGPSGAERPTPQTRPWLEEEVLPASSDMVTIPCTERAASFDADRVRSPLHLRSYEPGDRMQPFGMQGHKKLAELYREHGIPWDDRASMLVVEDATGEIIWAVGVTTADQSRITEETRRVLTLTLNPPPTPQWRKA